MTPTPGAGPSLAPGSDPTRHEAVLPPRAGSRERDLQGQVGVSVP